MLLGQAQAQICLQSCLLQFLHELGCRVISLLISHQATVISLIQPWLQVLFALHDAKLLSGMHLAGVTTKAIEPIHTGSSRVDIFLELYEASDGSVAGHIEYDSSLWKHSSINAMAANLLVRPGLFLSLAQHPPTSIPHLQAVLSVFVLYVFHVRTFPCQYPSVKKFKSVYCWENTLATSSLAFVCEVLQGNYSLLVFSLCLSPKLSYKSS